MAQSYSLDDVFQDAEPSTSKEESYSLDDVFKTQSSKKESKGWADSLDPTLRKTLQIGLPMAGAVAGGMLAAPLTGGLSGLGALGLLGAAEGVGSLGGESINQALGISPESTQEKGIALAAPLGGRALFGAIENIPRWIPGFGTALKGALTPEARDLPGKLLAGGKGSKQIYDELAQQAVSNTKIQQFPAAMAKNFGMFLPATAAIYRYSLVIRRSSCWPSRSPISFFPAAPLSHLTIASGLKRSTPSFVVIDRSVAS